MSTLTISTIQTNLFWQDKKANLSMLEEKIASIDEKTELIILPEMFTTGFTMQTQFLAEDMQGETVKWMQRISSENNIILTGSMIATENNKYYNRLIWMLPNGKYGYYDKRHLFALGDEHNHYSSGNKRLIASVNGWKINLQVCYDLRFPVWARQHIYNNKTELEFDILIYVGNWPDKRIHAWKTLLCARAIENQCYVIGVNRVGNDGNNIYYSGNSLVIDPMGQVLYYVADEEDINTITLEKEKLNTVRERFPFWKDADGFNFNAL